MLVCYLFRNISFEYVVLSHTHTRTISQKEKFVVDQNSWHIKFHKLFLGERNNKWEKKPEILLTIYFLKMTSETRVREEK